MISKTIGFFGVFPIFRHTHMGISLGVTSLHITPISPIEGHLQASSSNSSSVSKQKDSEDLTYPLNNKEKGGNI